MREVLWVSSIEEHKKPPNTSQQVLVVVKSEDRAPRSDRRVCKGLWNPTEDRVGVWRPQGCRLQGPSPKVQKEWVEGLGSLMV